MLNLFALVLVLFLAIGGVIAVTVYVQRTLNNRLPPPAEPESPKEDHK